MGSVAQFLHLAVVVGIAALLYLLPSFVASRRHHERAGTILLLNVLLGWTLAAWVVLFVWALSSRPVRSP